MTYLHHIHRLNTWNPADFCAFYVAGQHVGYVRHKAAEDIARLFHDDFQKRSDGALLLSDELNTPQSRTNALAKVAKWAADAGLSYPLRGEMYSVKTGWGHEPLAFVDRNTSYFLGLQNYSVYMNTFVRHADGLYILLSRRAAKKVDGGKIDVSVNGGQPSQLSFRQNIIKEASEEIGLSSGWFEKIQRVSSHSLTFAHAKGFLARETSACYDLEVPESFKPTNDTGEVQEFLLLPAATVLSMLERDKDSEFSYDAPYTLLDFMIRHGFVAPTHPEYQTLCNGLYGNLPQDFPHPQKSQTPAPQFPL